MEERRWAHQFFIFLDATACKNVHESYYFGWAGGDALLYFSATLSCCCRQPFEHIFKLIFNVPGLNWKAAWLFGVYAVLRYNRNYANRKIAETILVLHANAFDIRNRPTYRQHIAALVTLLVEHVCTWACVCAIHDVYVLWIICMMVCKSE